MEDTIKIRIEVALARRGLGWRDLGPLMGVPWTTVGSWAARGCRDPLRSDGVVSLARAASALCVPLEALQPGGPWGPLVADTGHTPDTHPRPADTATDRG